MKQYVISEEQYQAMLKELELEKLKGPDQFVATGYEELYNKMLSDVHRRFHYVVCKWINGP